MASPEARERFARKNEEDDLRRAFDFLDRKKDGVIDEDDLSQVFMSLGHKTKKGEIADMIWEVDEDCDGALNWKVSRQRSCDLACRHHEFVVAVSGIWLTLCSCPGHHQALVLHACWLPCNPAQMLRASPQPALTLR